MKLTKKERTILDAMRVTMRDASYTKLENKIVARCQNPGSFDDVKSALYLLEKDVVNSGKRPTARCSGCADEPLPGLVLAGWSDNVPVTACGSAVIACDACLVFTDDFGAARMIEALTGLAPCIYVNAAKGTRHPYYEESQNVVREAIAARLKK